MKKGRGKHKGSQFERDICCRLSLWVTAGARRDVFWRTATSGGRATVHKKRGELQRQAGDICAVAPEGHSLTDKFYFELKAYRDLKLATFLLECRGPLGQFWRAVCTEAHSYGKLPVLIVKQNRLPILVITGSDNSLVGMTNAMGVGFPPMLATTFVDAEAAVVYKLDELLLLTFKGGGVLQVSAGPATTTKSSSRKSNDAEAPRRRRIRGKRDGQE